MPYMLREFQEFKKPLIHERYKSILEEMEATMNNID